MNLEAIALASLSRVILVGLWWSPILFRDRWMRLTGHTAKTMRETLVGGTVFAIVGSILMAAVFERVIVGLGLHSVQEGAMAALWAWIGLIAPPMLSSVVYERKSFRLFLINSGFQLVALMVMGAILAVLRQS